MDPNKYKSFYEIMANEYCPEGWECYYNDDRFFNVRLFAAKGGEDSLSWMLAAGMDIK